MFLNSGKASDEKHIYSNSIADESEDSQGHGETYTQAVSLTNVGLKATKLGGEKKKSLSDVPKGTDGTCSSGGNTHSQVLTVCYDTQLIGHFVLLSFQTLGGKKTAFFFAGSFNQERHRQRL